MAGIVEVSCSTTSVPGKSERDDTAVRTNSTVSKQGDYERTLSPNSWGQANGSLPVAVPTNQGGQGFHCVESSTTDSGVSNASSVTSDTIQSLAAGEMSLPATELQFELTAVEIALHGRDLDDSVSGGELCVSGLSLQESEGEKVEADLSSDLRGLSTREGAELEAGNTSRGEYYYIVHCTCPLVCVCILEHVVNFYH